MRALAVTLVAVCFTTPTMAKPKFVPFDPPGSISTTPTAINSAGDITGYFLDQNSLPHGFVRLADGTMQTFDVPSDLNGTRPYGINDKGEISGTWIDGAVNYHGFLRSPSGTITIADPPNTVFGASLGGINKEGQAAGSFYNGTAVQGFIVKNDKFQVFSVLDAEHTNASAINDKSVVIGTYVSSGDGNEHFYLRDKKGHATAFDVQDGSSNMNAVAISATGYIICEYTYTEQQNEFSVERSPNGSLEAIIPSKKALNTYVTGVTDDGSTVGSYQDASKNTHGFSATVDGVSMTIDYPHVKTFTQITAINSTGVMAGSYGSDYRSQHGFVRTP